MSCILRMMSYKYYSLYLLCSNRQDIQKSILSKLECVDIQWHKMSNHYFEVRYMLNNECHMNHKFLIQSCNIVQAHTVLVLQLGAKG